MSFHKDSEGLCYSSASVICGVRKTGFCSQCVFQRVVSEVHGEGKVS